MVRTVVIIMQLGVFGVEFRESAQFSYVTLTAENQEMYGEYILKSKKGNKGIYPLCV